jgi:hypothetical protein
MWPAWWFFAWCVGLERLGFALLDLTRRWAVFAVGFAYLFAPPLQGFWVGFAPAPEMSAYGGKADSMA